jgi:hypothetical protein
MFPFRGLSSPENKKGITCLQCILVHWLRRMVCSDQIQERRRASHSA